MNIKALPWPDGKNAALSLIFNDWTTGQWAIALPFLNSRKLQGTFFVTLSHFDLAPHADHWGMLQSAARHGHEIANHTDTHSDLTAAPPSRLFSEIEDAKRTIEENLYGVEVTSFAYPFGKFDRRVMEEVAKTHLAAHGFDEKFEERFLDYRFAKEEADYYGIMPYRLNADLSVEKLKRDLAALKAGGGFLCCLTHGVYNEEFAGDKGWYDAMPITTFESLVEAIQESEEDIWIAPFRDITNYHRSVAGIRFAREDGVANRQVFDVSCDCAVPPESRPRIAVELRMDPSAEVASVSQDGEGLEWKRTDGEIRFDIRPIASKIEIDTRR